MTDVAVVTLTVDQVEKIVDRAITRALAERGPSASEVLTRDQVADELQICAKQVAAFAKSGKLRGIKLGREWRFRRADVQAFLDRSATSGRLQIVKGGKV